MKVRYYFVNFFIDCFFQDVLNCLMFFSHRQAFPLLKMML